MCGEGCVEKMRENWNKYVPRILKLDKEYEATPVADNGEVTEAMQQRALKILDKQLRCSGPSAKAPGAFSIYEVVIAIAI